MNDWKIYALGSALFAGLTAILAKTGISHVPSTLATLIRAAVITVFLAAIIQTRQEWNSASAFDSKSLIFIVLSAIAAGLSWMCYFQALQKGPASMVAAIDKLSLLATVLLSVLFLRERLNFIQWTGVLMMTAGSILVAFKS